MYKMIAIWVKNPETAMCVYQSLTNELIDGRWWKPGFSLLEKEVTDKQGAGTGGQNEPCDTGLETEL